MQRAPSTFPLANFVLFIVLALAILIGHFLWMQYAHPRPPQPEAEQPATKQAPAKSEAPKVKGKAAEAEKEKEKEKKKKENPQAAPPAKIAAVPARSKTPPQWVSLGSADPKAPYRMLVTLSNRGAALVRIELSSARYHDLDDRSGYLGHVVIEDDFDGNGCPVQVVGAGTPAAAAGLKPGDLIAAIGGESVKNALDLEESLRKTKPRQQVELTVLRDGKNKKLTATLGWRPLEVVRPERKDPHDVVAGKASYDAVRLKQNCPLSMLSTIQQIDDQRIDDESGDLDVERELKGLHLRAENWQVAAADQEHVVFRQALPEWGLAITKTYRLAKVPGDHASEADFPAYHLTFELAIKNVGDKSRKVAYRLDGPNGLPREGWWYANKVNRNWGAGGLRDVVVSFDHDTPQQVGCPKIADGKLDPPWQDEALTFISVDAQYFSAVLLSQGDTATDIDQSMPLRVGDVDPERKNITNISFRLIGKTHKLGPGETLQDRFELFAGPKKPTLLKQYQLDKMVYYGWFGWVAEPMLWTLHAFYWVLRNYGLAIILLTVLVRLCMFPFSRKQALNAQKMQELQPEIKKIQEKYKKDMEGRTKAQQDLFRKHNYNPLSGCLVLFIQLPIFVGLYRSLMVDVELRDAPLISEAVRWCSNLAGPDMFYNWSGFMPEFVNRGVGMFQLGPYFNLLPIFTIVLFIIQQKMFMPPATDEQSAMQQKVMKYMMVFMGIMFYKVASGLCIYFIASSLWGVTERMILPKTKKAAAADDDAGPQPAKRWPWQSPPPDRNAERRKRNRGKR